MENKNIASSKNKFALDSVWGFDSEFITSKKVQKGKSAQFHGMNNTKIFCKNHADVNNFFHTYLPKHIFAFNLACELGTLELFDFKRKRQSPEDYDWHEFPMGSQLRASLILDTYDKSRHPKVINFYDIQALCRQLGFSNLSKVGDFLVTKNLLPYSKLPDKKCKECMICDNFEICSSQDAENNPKFDCKTYALFDAEIVYKMVEFMHNNWGFDHRVASLGTFAKNYFNLPRRLSHETYTSIINGKQLKIRKYVLPKEEIQVQKSLFAGRSDAYMTGYIENTYYLDVKSLYPVSTILTHANRISGVEKCSMSEITMTKNLDNQNFGWIFGEFECNDSLWSLPFRYDNRNYYVTGSSIRGVYNTMDLLASNSKIKKVYSCWKPIYSEEADAWNRHKKYKELFFKKINDTFTTSAEKLLGKGILNALTGKYGQAKPCLSACTNYPAYSSLLANSHLVMSELFRKFNFIAYIDTDSIFTDVEDTGEFFNVDGIPIILDCKNKGDIFIIRSKMYSWKDPKNNKYDTYHAWKGQQSDFTKLIKQTFNSEKIPNDYNITIQKTATPNTREKQMQKTPLGYFWKEEKNLNQTKLKALLHADPKRQRPTYNSLQLIAEHTHAESKPHNIARMPTNVSQQISFEDMLIEIANLKKVKTGTTLKPTYPRKVIYIK
jgi:hypothetical protein